MQVQDGEKEVKDDADLPFKKLGYLLSKRLL